MLPTIVSIKHGISYLCADGKPFPILGGELHNSASSSLTYMQEHVWPSLHGMEMNTALAAISWETFEPQEGQFDFFCCLALLSRRKKKRYGSFFCGSIYGKNGESYYVPEWVKKDRHRFFRARFPDGCETATISPFCMEAVEKERQAFVRMMTWLKEHDEHHTVLMIQVENEVGLLGTDRDHCDAACMAWQKPIPAEAQDVLGLTGCWENYPHLGEAFMAWQYAQDLESIASAGKAVLPLPMYANAWLAQHPERAGVYPTGGPVARLIPLWQKAAPSLDMLSPDIYVKDFKTEC